MDKNFTLGLRGKVTLSLAFILIVSLTITSILSYIQSQNVAEQKVIELQESKLAILKNEINGSLQEHQNILRSLHDVPPVQAIIRAKINNGIDPENGDSLYEWNNRLRTIFSAFILNHPQYLQIRYIDNLGNEMVRVQREVDDTITVILDDNLQNKINESYVKDTLKLEENQVFFSSVTLNREHGSIQVPHLPVLRIATPVHQADTGIIKGLIVINLATEELFSDIESNNNGEVQYVVDEKGNYLKHSSDEKTFASDKATEHYFKYDYPHLAELSNIEDKVLRRFASRGEIAGFQKIYFLPNDKSRFWLLTLKVPEAVVFSDIKSSLNVMLFVGLLVGVLSLLLIVWFVTKRILNPVLTLAKAAERLQDGDLTVRLDASSVHDEFKTLYQTINTFTQKQQEFTVNLQQEIESQTHKLSAVIENVVDGIITINRKGQITTFNQAAQRIFGYKDSEVIGENVKILMPTPYHEEHDGYLFNHLTTGVKKIIGIGREVIGLRKDGSEFPLELAISEVKIDNSLHFIGITRDITERKRIELMQKEFISTVSHELRTPLTSISGSLGLILGGITGELSDKTRSLLTIANNNSERLIHLINDILDIEKISAGKMQFDFTDFNISELVTKSLDENKGYAEKLSVSFNLISDVDNKTLVRIDEKRMLQVMSNLLSNAAKYSPPNKQVDISIVQKGNKVRVSVHDEGKGIPEEFKRQIFSKFSQADSSDTRQKGGTGLGLNITKAIILQHKGEIGFDSSSTDGTTFYFDLPISVENEKSTIKIEKRNKDKPLVLVIENDEDVSQLLGYMLENAGYQFDQAFDYAHALQKIKTNKYDAITLDLILPDGSGINILRELRSHKRTQNIPVIVVSAIVNEGKQEVEGDAFEMVDWIEKPINSERLIGTIQASIYTQNEEVASILHVEDDPDISEIVASLLGQKFQVTNVDTLSKAKEVLNQEVFDLVLLDIGLPDGSGLDLLPLLHNDEHQIPVVIFSAQDIPEGVASNVMATLIKSKTNNEKLMKQINLSIQRRI